MDASANTPSNPSPADALPRRALNLARRMLDIERKVGGRAQVTIVLTMMDGEWLLMVARPGELERLGE